MALEDIARLARESPEIRLLRMDTLPLVATVVRRAFTGVNLVEIERNRLLRIIADILEEFRLEGIDYDQDPKRYLSRWLGQLASDKEIGCVWFGTSGRNGQDLITLLPAGRRIVEFIETSQVPRQAVAASGLTEFCEMVDDVSGRIAGDVEGMIATLATRRDEIDQKIADLRERGARRPDQRELKEIGERIVHLTAEILAGFGAIPQELADHNLRNEELYAEVDAPRGEILQTIIGRDRELTQSPSYRLLKSLNDLYLDDLIRKRLLDGLGMVRDACGDFLISGEHERFDNIIEQMAGIADRMLIEQARASQQMRDYIMTGDFARRRESVRLVRLAQTLISDIRDIVEPTPRDARLKDLGFRVMMPFVAGPLVDLRLANSVPDAPPVRAAAVVVESDAEAVFEQNIQAIASARWTSIEETSARVRQALEGAEELPLSKLLDREPLRYGIEELSQYLIVGASILPARYDEGRHIDRPIEIEGVRFRVRCPDPVFLRAGEPGQGLLGVRGAQGVELSVVPEALARPADPIAAVA